MKCPICKNELDIKNKKVGENANGEAIYNEFAICHECKKQWNLDKQRAKTTSPEETRKEDEQPKKPRKRPASPEKLEDDNPSHKTMPIKNTPKKEEGFSETNDLESALEDIAKAEGTLHKKQQPKKRPAKSSSSAEKEVGENKPVRPAAKKRPAESKTESEKRPVKKRPAGSAPEPEKAKRPVKRRSTESEGIRRPQEETHVKKSPDRKPPVKKRPAVSHSAENDSLREERPKVQKRRSMKPEYEPEEQSYSNIPPRHVREARENEMRENYQHMLDEGDDYDEGGLPTIVIVLIVILILAAAAFAGYWFFLR